MQPTVATTTRAIDTDAFFGNPIASAAATPSTGVMRGASNIAPITTAADPASNPITATTTERDNITPNRQYQCVRLMSARSFMTRRRSSGSRWRCQKGRLRRNGSGIGGPYLVSGAPNGATATTAASASGP